MHWHLRSSKGDEVQNEDAAEFLDRLIHQIVPAAARGLDLERESPGRNRNGYLLVPVKGERGFEDLEAAHYARPRSSSTRARPSSASPRDSGDSPRSNAARSRSASGSQCGKASVEEVVDLIAGLIAGQVLDANVR